MWGKKRLTVWTKVLNYADKKCWIVGTSAVLCGQKRWTLWKKRWTKWAKMLKRVKKIFSGREPTWCTTFNRFIYSIFQLSTCFGHYLPIFRRDKIVLTQLL
jgi:hypothetical protein